MSWMAFILIVMSAVLHASWNILAKKNRMTMPFYGIICSTAALMWVHVQFWTPIPVWSMPWQFWASLAGSVFSDAVIYCGGLVMAYRLMDMSSAYPMMRSLPLLLTAALTTLLGWGKPLTAMALAGMAVVFAGCLMMPLNDFRNFRISNYINSHLLFILLVACGTTGYTVFDSQAQQIMRSELPDISKPVMALTYYSSRGIVLTLTLFTTVFLLKNERANLKRLITERNWTPVLAGLFATFSYGLVLIAMNYVSNVSYVQVFRQLGLLVGVAGGILILKERCSVPKISGSLLIVTGLIMTVL